MIINTLSAQPPTFEVSGCGWASPGVFRVSFTGSPNTSYRVWGSPNLGNWTQLGTATSLGNGSYQFIDPYTAGIPERFYRVTGP